MKKFVIASLVLLLVVLGVWLWRAHISPPAATLLPAQTLVFVRVPDVPRAAAQWKQSAAHALWQQPEVRAFLHETFGPLQPPWLSGLTNGAGLAEAQTLLRGEAFLAITHFSPLVPNRPGIAIGADTGWQQWRARVAIATLERRVRQRNPDIQFRHRQFMGVRYMMWERPNDLPICYALVRTWLVATLGEDVMRDLISRQVRPGRHTTLQQMPEYIAFTREVPADAALHVYLNPQPLTMLLGHAQLFAGADAGALGSLQAVRSVGLAVSCHQHRVHERRITHYRPEHWLPSPPVSRRTLQFTSPDTLWYRAGSVNWARSYSTISQLLLQLGLPAPTAVIENFERRLRRANIRWTDDVLAQLGPETAWLLQWRHGAELPEIAWITELRDAARIRPGLQEALLTLGTLITQHANVPAVWDESSAGPHTVRFLMIGDGKISPAFVITDEFLLLTTSRDFARSLVETHQASGGSLADDPTFQSFTAGLPTSCAEFSYLRLAELYPHMHGFVRTWSSYLPFPLGRLPPVASTSLLLTPVVSVTTSTNSAEVTDVYSPFGTPVAWVAAWAVTWAAQQQRLFPTATTTSSSRAVVPRPAENPMATSQIPLPSPLAPRALPLAE